MRKMRYIASLLVTLSCLACSTNNVSEGSATDRSKLINFINNDKVKRIFVFWIERGTAYQQKPLTITDALAKEMTKNLIKAPLKAMKFQVWDGRFVNQNRVVIKHRMFKGGDKLILKLDNKFYHLINYSTVESMEIK